jgi:type II secretory pathway pseudopilin PulG
MEMAVVLMILGTLMSGILVAVSQTTENNRRSAALLQLRQIEDALYGYAQANGRLPCPATAASAGKEAPVGGGICTAWHGFVPIATIGMYGSINADGLLMDPWQNPYRYSVAQKSVSGNRAFTSTAGMDLIYANSATELVAGTEMLRICDGSACAGTVIAETVPAVVLSMGADWATFTSANEQENASGTTLTNGSNSYSVTNTRTFVATGYAEDLFDDQLVWLSPYIMFNRMISAGKLP